MVGYGGATQAHLIVDPAAPDHAVVRWQVQRECLDIDHPDNGYLTVVAAARRLLCLGYNPTNVIAAALAVCPVDVAYTGDLLDFRERIAALAATASERQPVSWLNDTERGQGESDDYCPVCAEKVRQYHLGADTLPEYYRPPRWQWAAPETLRVESCTGVFPATTWTTCRVCGVRLRINLTTDGVAHGLETYRAVTAPQMTAVNWQDILVLLDSVHEWENQHWWQAQTADRQRQLRAELLAWLYQWFPDVAAPPQVFPVPNYAEQQAAAQMWRLFQIGQSDSRECEAFCEGISYYGKVLRATAVIIALLRQWHAVPHAVLPPRELKLLTQWYVGYGAALATAVAELPLFAGGAA